MPDQLTPPVVRPRTEPDDPAIVDAFNHVFGTIWGEHFAPRSTAHLRWQYADRGLGDRAMLAHDHAGQVLAFWGGQVLPVDSTFGPQVFVHSCDNFALPEHRHNGLFVRLAQAAVARCIARGVAVGFGFPLPAAHQVDRRHLGTQDLYEVEYLCLDTQTDLAKPSAVTVTVATSLGAEVDRLYTSIRHAYSCLTRRDAAYLSWRYLACPSADYRVLTAHRASTLTGLAVVRPYHELRPGAGAIVDWLAAPDDAETCDALLAASLAITRDAQRRVLLTSFSPHSRERTALLARGFAAIPSRESLAHPLACLVIDQRFSYDWLREHWWLTLGDSDLG